MHESQPGRPNGSIIIETNILIELLSTDSISLATQRANFHSHKLFQLVLNGIPIDILRLASKIPGSLRIPVMIEDTNPRIHWRLDHLEPGEFIRHSINNLEVVWVQVVEVLEYDIGGWADLDVLLFVGKVVEQSWVRLHWDLLVQAGGDIQKAKHWASEHSKEYHYDYAKAVCFLKNWSIFLSEHSLPEAWLFCLSRRNRDTTEQIDSVIIPPFLIDCQENNKRGNLEYVIEQHSKRSL